MMKKLLLMIMLICAIVVMPRVFADDAKTIAPGDVEVITSNDTLSSGEAKKETSENTTTITYDVATFKILEGTEEAQGGRPADKAWVGIRVKKPTNATKYKTKLNGGTESAEETLSGDSFDKYIGFDEKELKEATEKATDLVNVLQITWSGEEGTTPITQVVKVVLVAKNITLKDKDGNTDVWNNEKWEESIPKVKVTLKAYKDGKEVSIPEGIISTYELKEVYALTSNQIEGARNVLMDDGIEFVGIFMDKDLKTPFVETQKFSTDTILYVAYRTGSDVPETGAFTSYLLLTVGALIAVSVLVIAQKYNRIYHV